MNLDPLEKTQSDIKQYGWQCMHIAPRVGDTGSHFTYSIGLYETYKHPEIMIFGLANDTAHGVLSECVKMIKNGTRFPTEQPVMDVLAGDFEVIFKPVKSELFDEYLGIATDYYGERSFDALVLFWPDKNHKFPWESEELASQSEALNLV